MAKSSGGSTAAIELDLTGGRNGADSPLALPNDQCVEALNVDWFKGQIGNRRGGAVALSLSGGTAPTAPINALTRYVPASDEGAAELWLIDAAATPVVKRLAGGTSWADVTLTDAITSRPQDAEFAVLNGKLYIAYPSAKDRLHVYDPGMASPRVRRVGIDPGSSAPTVADTGSGTYAATARHYRVRFCILTAGVRVALSEPTPDVAFTPSGSGTAARVTRPTAPSESETHWIIEGAYDAEDPTAFYELAAEIAIGTTTYDDSALVTTYSNGDLSDDLGTYELPTSVKYLLTDGNRLVMTGNNTSGNPTSRVWWTPVLGSGTADDERIPVLADTIRNYTDVGEKDGSAVTGLGGPLSGGRIYVFKYRAIWLLTPTGDPLVPYLVRKVYGGTSAIGGIGNIDGAMIVNAFDDAGQAAVYFWSEVGPYRLGSNGLEFIGWDIKDIVVNLSATTKVGHGIFYPPKMQVWWWIATGSSNEPDTKVVFDIRKGRSTGTGEVRRGWSRHDGLSAAARCSCLFANTVAASMSRDLKPYVGRAGATAKILKCDTTDQNDDGTPFQAYVKTRPLGTVLRNGRMLTMERPIVIATAQNGVSLALTADLDFGRSSVTSAVDLTPELAETRVIRPCEGLEAADASAIQLQIGDAQAQNATWTVDQLTIPLADGGVK